MNPAVPQASDPLPWSVDGWWRAARPTGETFVTVTDGDDAGAAWEALGENDVLVHATGRGRPGLRAPHPFGSLKGATIERFVAFPGTGGSHVLVGTAPRRAVARSLDLLPAGRRRWRLVRAGLRPLTKFGIVDRLGLPTLTVAHRGARPTTHLVAALGVHGLFRKTVLRVGDAKGTARRFVKVGATEPARESIEREARALDRLATRAPALGPALLDEGSVGDLAWLAQAPVEGTRSRDVLGPPHAAFLRELMDVDTHEVPLAQLATWRRTRADLAALRGEVDSVWCDAMDGLADVLADHVGAHPVPCGISHGDFTPWNLIDGHDGLVAIDWEFAEALAPRGRDLCHFHLQTGILVRHAEARTLHRELVELLNGPFAFAACGSADATIAFALLHQAVHDERTNAIERPPFEQVAWLRRERLALATILTHRLADSARPEQEVAA